MDDTFFGWTENPQLVGTPLRESVRESAAAVRKQSTDQSYTGTEGSSVRRTHEEVYRDLMRKDAERKQRRNSAQLLAEVCGHWCRVVSCRIVLIFHGVAK